MQYQLDDKTIYYNVSYVKSQKLTMDISPEGFITIRVPKNTEESIIINFLQSKKKEILKVLNRIENRTTISRTKEYHEEETFLYQGKVYKLSQLITPMPEDEQQIQLELKRFYTQETRKIIKERVGYYEKQIGVKAKSVTIVDSAKTWGTCNNNRDLTFNYRLSMAPIPVVDSIVIHELCHILHLNHDRSFWRKVGTYDANYKEHHGYLDRFGFYMTI
jgi:predicted metal-dependent hydrolase